MEIKFEQISVDIMAVYLKGRIDLETIERFLGCLDHLKSYKVIFDLKDLCFVGSNGISIFVSAIQQLNQTSCMGITFCHASSEFKRIFAATFVPEIVVHEDFQKALRAISIPQAITPSIENSAIPSVSSVDSGSNAYEGAKS
ncbi:MAG: STAS domain-containing protein [Bdellovibrionales bacterium]|nr:STAS domain-containing protein [Bdellovibrionales bacterium]